MPRTAPEGWRAPTWPADSLTTSPDDALVANAALGDIGLPSDISLLPPAVEMPAATTTAATAEILSALDGTGLPTAAEASMTSAPISHSGDSTPLGTSDIDRVLGDIGLPTDKEIKFMSDSTVTAPSDPEVEVFFPPAKPEVIPRYTEDAGIADARDEVERYHSYERAINVLDNTERTPRTDAIHDQLILKRAEEIMNDRRFHRGALDFLDRQPCRTVEQQVIVNEYYDRIIEDQIRQTYRGTTGSLNLGAALTAAVSANPRTEAGQRKVVQLHDSLLVDAILYEIAANRRNQALSLLRRFAPITPEGKAGVAAIEEEHRHLFN